MKGFCPLASGSQGNCLYLGSEKTKILIDAGISTRAASLRLSQIGVKLEDIDAILITHEHTDHIQGLRVAAYKKGIPVFANSETAKGIVQFFRNCPKFKIFTTGEPFIFRDLEICPFGIQHDTPDPVAFTIQTHAGEKIGICTDLGFATSSIRAHLQGCDYLYLEANHEPSMVHACPRPHYYKQRVLSRMGHLSNEACGNLLSEIAHGGLHHVYLAHLSQECNSPQVALRVIEELLKKRGMTLSLSVAKQKESSKLIKLK